MSVDKDTVRRIARLARIRVDEDALEPLANELSTILTFVEQLDAVNTDGVEPQAGGRTMALKQRADEINAGGYPDKVTANAPKSEHNFFAVPKVVE